MCCFTFFQEETSHLDVGLDAVQPIKQSEMLKEFDKI